VLRLLWAAIAACLLVVASDAHARVHVVAPGESLSALAARYGVPIADLRAWNELRGDTVRVGQALTVDPPEGPDVHRVRPGETLGRIAVRHRLALAQILALNPGLEPERLREGALVVIAPPERSQSVGSPGGGSIEGAVRLGPHPAYLVRNPERAYGTERTLGRLREGFDALLLAEPDAPRVRVHDLSLRAGGPIDDHRTHRSGRDVDITYYQRSGCGPGGCPLRAVRPAELDVRRQWRLLLHWLSRGELEVAYVDRALQRPLYEEARAQGASAAELEAWFQYPRSTSAEAGIVRHYPNHADHVHVRFACHPTETRCEPSRDGP